MSSAAASPARPHRVGINLLWLVPRVVGGSEQSTVGYLSALADAQPDDLDITLFALPALVEAHPALTGRFTTVVAPLSGSRKGLRAASESTWLAGQVARRRLDLVHHAGGVVPPVRAAPSVLTVHDLQPLAMPDNFSLRKRRYLGAMLPRSVRAARLVLTPSEFVRRDLVERLDADPARVLVAPHGLDPRDHPAPSSARRAALRHALRLPGPFFVCPAITYPHKNQAVLVRAFSDVVAAHPEAVLVLAGSAGPSEAALAEEIERAGVGRSVRRTGWLPTADVDALLCEATALAFPSRYEGFGLPMLEAMHAGAPVLAAATTALPEVVGDAGILVDPDDAQEWSRQMRKMIEEPGVRSDFAARGHARVAAFTWQRTVGVITGAYRRAIDGTAPGVGG
jgi:alpha-1,3-rhamnosyl/mannosyltransferase